jgi:hypothetical protein
MKGIAATVGAGGQTNHFWLDGGFGMRAEYPAGELLLGGVFTSVPAAITAMARGPLLITTDNGTGGDAVERANVILRPNEPIRARVETAGASASRQRWWLLPHPPRPQRVRPRPV